jgi:hypothetical protein
MLRDLARALDPWECHLRRSGSEVFAICRANGRVTVAADDFELHLRTDFLSREEKKIGRAMVDDGLITSSSVTGDLILLRLPNNERECANLCTLFGLRRNRS